jgi:flagellar motor switch protein FliN/FliY
VKTNQATDKNQLNFSNAFFLALVSAMTEACELQWQIADAPDDGSASEGSEPVRMRLTLDGSLSGDCLLEFQRPEAIMLASKLLRQPVDEFGDEQNEALLGLVEAAAKEFCAALEPEYGAFTISASSDSQPPSDLVNAVQITAASDDSNRITVSMYFDSALAEGICAHSPAGGAATEDATSVKDADGEATPESVNMDLVMDVELNVTLRFGKRQLTLREVMELTSGSVVELDRQVDEPVELLLNGAVIAKGEAVVIDGNYGLRVTEVSQHASSLVLR